MGFRTPYKKMSKSDQDSNNIVRILDNSELIKRKIKSACTDSEDPPQILFNVEKKSGISNLINIFSSLTDLSISETENRFFGKNYSYFKSSICKILIEKLERIQKKFFYIRKQEKFLKKVLKEGSGHARIIAEKTMERVLSAIGLEKIF
ncbi:tryptophanyl-tRNA synthetase [Candidatus Riesia pediculischaeffi PTSU]|uniref:Tryptophanyl-tRNA synthetase n=1 Tax=Candidatus Riesia pediculischaeffi PTSU TaxID=1401651 RepID=A0A0C1V8R4_9ENTR|nr:tryptophanyl-tRNA synthetase [Candidatus Riesia pediculischaeffi PTSU]